MGIVRAYKTVKRAVCATLFTKKISASDADQNATGDGLGDCYFVSSVAVIAEYEPGLIEAMFNNIGNGNYEVAFYDAFDDAARSFKSFPWKKMVVVIDSILEMDGARPKYSYTVSDEHEMWWPLLEKAYATWRGGYGSIGNGGYHDAALSELTGRKSTCVSTESKYFKSDAIRTNMVLGIFEKAVRNNYKMVCATRGEGEQEFNDKNNPDVYSGHAYSFLAYNHDTHMIQLRNPWGTGSGPDGYFWISVPDFLKYYDSISYVA
jgi:hypothetical protein